MKFSLTIPATLITLLTVVGTVHASDLSIYPANGQSEDQQIKDEYECYDWARRDSGFDPMGPKKTYTPAPETKKKSGGVAKSSLTGLAVGAILGDSSKYAARGALVGGLFGGIRQSSHNRKVDEERAQWERDQAMLYRLRREDYNRAFSACLEGRGYSVK